MLNRYALKRNHPLGYAAMLMLVCCLISFTLRMLFYAKANLIAEETYYWNYAQHLDWGYLDHPPMVAVLIYLSTHLFGLHEWSVRLPAFLCWIGTGFFSYQLTEQMSKQAGIYSLFLLSVLPCFFIQSLIMSPDQPLILCWAAVLYYVYKALVQNIPSAWYHVGLWFGLGMLSKYTIALLLPGILMYMLFLIPGRSAFYQKEPYLAALISLIFFTPVIYWNATHEWASFAFQSIHRFSDDFYFYVPYFFLFIFIFTTHLGIYGLFQLIKWRPESTFKKADRFFIFTVSILPLAFFGYQSYGHVIKVNWIIPTLLGLIPWFSHLIKQANKTRIVNYYHSWVVTGIGLLMTYAIFLSYILYDVPDLHLKKLLANNMAWGSLTKEINLIAHQTEDRFHTEPILVGLDRYYINSELSFYQALFAKQNNVLQSYPTIGRHVFNRSSLMYQYWYTTPLPKNTILILIATHPNYFNMNSIKKNTSLLSSTQSIQALSQGKSKIVNQYYYQIVKTHETLNKNLS